MEQSDAEALDVRELTASFGAFRLRIDALRVDAGRTLAIVGPSGAGKTSLLECIAGFRSITGGRVRVGGRDVTRLAPEDRRIGFVFQDYALFPHLSVLENVRFGLRARGADDRQRAMDALERMGVAALANRRPGTLSGGEQQRVAVARAFAISPALLLFDEPLSAVDAPTRDELRESLRALTRDLTAPSIYVTHDQAEAFAIGDDVMVMMGGGIRQGGPAAEVYANPADTSVARFLGMEAIAGARVVDEHTAHAGDAAITIERSNGVRGAAALAYRPEDVELMAASGATPANSFELCVSRISPAGPCDRIVMDGVVPLTALVMRRTRVQLGLREGDRVRAILPPTAIHVLTADDDAHAEQTSAPASGDAEMPALVERRW